MVTRVREAGRRLRRLRRAKAWAGFVVLCLGLGLAATAVIAAVVDAYLLRPLPFSEPDRLLSIWKLFDTEQARGLQYFLHPADFALLREEVGRLEVAAYQPADLDLTGTGEPERVSGARVSGELFSLLGLQASAGRLLTPEDERTEAAVALVEEGFARRRFGATAGALGEVLSIAGEPHLVVGVLPAGVGLPSGAEVWAPLTRREHEGRLGFSVVGRIADGVSRLAAVEEVRRLGARLVEVDPDRNGNAGLDADALQRNLVGDLRPTLLALVLAVLLLLGIACANATCLVLSRARRRDSERALEEILGAGRLRLLLDSLVENGLLAALAAGLALLVATALLPLLLTLSPVDVFTFAPVRLDGRIAALVVVLAGAMAGVFSLAALFGGGGLERLRSGRRLVGTPRALTVLVVVDVFLTSVLLVGAGATLETVHRLARVDPGFEPAGLYTVGVAASPIWSGEHARRVAFFERVLAEAESLPGVESVAAVHKPPMTQPEFYWGFNVEGQPPADADANEVVLFRVITPGYSRTLGMELLAGRALRRDDSAEAAPVVLVNRAFAERYFGVDAEAPGGARRAREVATAALGKRLKGGRYGGPGEWKEIVGVLSDARERGLAQPVVPVVFMPHAQRDRAYLAEMSVVVRGEAGGRSPIPALRERIRRIDAGAVLFAVETMPRVVARSLSRQRFSLSLLGLFALLATVQAAAGIYGVMSFDVGSRVREIGVRLALGARPAAVRRWVLRGGLVRGALGLGPGLVAAVLLMRWGESRWLDVTEGGPSIYVLVAALTAAVVLAATDLPARRAAAVDPARTLQEE